MARRSVPQVERRMRRNVEQLRVFLPSLDARVSPRERIVEIVADVLVELLVLVVGDLALRPCPQRGRLVDRLVLVSLLRLAVRPSPSPEDRLDDGPILADDRPELGPGQQIVRPSRRCSVIAVPVATGQRFDVELAATVGPAHAERGRVTGAPPSRR